MSKRINQYGGTGTQPASSSSPPPQQYVNYLNIIAFLILYIIVFIYLFKDDFQITSFIILSIFHLFFTIFVVQLIATNVPTSYLAISIWFSIFVGLMIKLVSLILMIVTFKKFDDKYISKSIAVKFSHKIKKMLNDYKILFITSISLIILFIFATFMIDFNNKSMVMLSLSGFFITIINLAIIGISSTELAFSNQFIDYEKSYHGDNP